MSGNKTTPSKASDIEFSDPVLPCEAPSEYQSGLALSHGLSVRLDPLIQQDLINPILDRLASEDLPEHDPFGDSGQAEFLKEAKAALKSVRSCGDRQAKRELNAELRSTERYYRRAANQLIKTLRTL